MKRTAALLTVTAALLCVAAIPSFSAIAHDITVDVEVSQAPATATGCSATRNSNAAAAICWSGDSNDAVAVKVGVTNSCTKTDYVERGTVVHVRTTSTWKASSGCEKTVWVDFYRYDCWFSACPRINVYTNDVDHAAIEAIHEHVHPDVVLPPGAVVAAEFGDITTPAQAIIARPDLFAPDLATGCYISPNRGHYVKATCPSYSGTGSRGFQVRGLAWNGCNKYIHLYGTSGVAGVRSSYIPGPGPGYFLPFPWQVVNSWIVKTTP